MTTKEQKCKYCDNLFRSHKALLYHQNKDVFCKNYINNLFVCSKCLYYTKNIKHIQEHNKVCDKNEGYNIENIINILDIYKNTIADLEEENRCLRNQLSTESFKKDFYRHIIEQNTTIKIDDLLLEKEDGMHITKQNKK